jgi:hypothetical protein
MKWLEIYAMVIECFGYLYGLIHMPQFLCAYIYIIYNMKETIRPIVQVHYEDEIK